MDHYELLGVDKKASAEDINKAFRAKALELHPDRNPSPEAAAQFKKIADAYAILSDPHKRAQYELSRSSVQSTRNFYADMFSMGRRRYGESIKIDVTISLEEAFAGLEREITYERRTKCDACNGEGGTATKCKNCDGKGKKVIKGGPNLQITLGCEECEGKGFKVTSTCDDCQGTGLISGTRKTLKIEIPAGTESQSEVRFRGLGHAGPFGSPAGNLTVLIHVKKHEFFQRLQAGDLTCKVPVTYTQLLLGDEVDVPTIDKKIVSLKIPPRTQPDTKFRLAKQGMPIYQADGRRGDLFVHLQLEIPQKLDGDYIEVAERLVKFEQSPELFPVCHKYRQNLESKDAYV